MKPQILIVLGILAVLVISGCVQNTGQTISKNEQNEEQETAESTNQPEIQKCTANWLCTEWGQCTDGIQTRICADANSCGDASSKPPETRGCVIIEHGEPMATISVQSVNSYWFDYTKQGSIYSVKVLVSNIGNFDIEPEYDVRVKYGQLSVYTDEGQSSFLSLRPGENKTDTIWIGADIDGSGTYTIEIDLRDQGSHEILDTGIKKVAIG